MRSPKPLNTHSPCSACIDFSPILPKIMTPASLTQVSMRPNRSLASAAIASTSPRRPTSATTNVASPPAWMVLAVMKRATSAGSEVPIPLANCTFWVAIA